MQDQTVRELLNLRAKGVLTDEELNSKLEKCLNMNDLTNGTEEVEVEHTGKRYFRNHKKWNAEEDKRLIELRNRGNSWSTIGKLMGRKRIAVTGRYFVLMKGNTANVVPRKHKPYKTGMKRGRWEKSEEDYVRMMYPKLSAKQIAQSLKERTPDAIKSRAHFLGVFKRHMKPSDTVQVGENKYPKKFSVGP